MSSLFLLSYIVLWILTLFLGILQLAVLHNLGAIYEQLPKLNPAPTKLKTNDYLPALTLKHHESEQVISTNEFKGARTEFSIVSPLCEPCISYLQRISTDRAQLDLPDASIQERVIIVVGGSEEVAKLLHRVQLPNNLMVLVDSAREVVEIWGITSTPAAIFVGSDHRVQRQTFVSKSLN